MSLHDGRHRHLHPHLLITTTLLLFLTTQTTGDDAAVMSKLSTTLSSTPPTWTTTTPFCNWDGIQCDNSNRVTSINLPDKSLTGTLPSDLNQLTQLKTLSLPRNHIAGPLPTLANLTLLEQVILESNNFTSIPPDFFSGLTNLKTVRISDNPDLSPWVVPDTLGENSNLQTFEASNANIVGSIPDIFDKFTNLQNLRLSYNNLTGALPPSFGGSQIQNLWLNNQVQGLSGNLDVISLMTQISQAWLQANSFTGAIPDLTNCTILFDLQLRDNQLTGLVPESLMGLPKLANVTLQNNRLQGPLPVFKSGVITELGNENTNSFCLPTSGPCDPQVTALLAVAGAIGYPISLAQSWKGNDACNGWLFISCDSSEKNVTSVSFGKQKFSGTISPAFANLTSLRSLSLNDNDLSGSIPETLTSLPDLQLLDVSNNDLSGPIPVFPPRVKFTHAGNALLGQNVSSGPPGSGPGPSNKGGSSKGTEKGGSGSTGMVVGIVIGVLVFVVIILFVCYKCYTKKKNQKPVKVQDPENGKQIVKASVMGGSSNAHNGVSELQSQSSGDHTEMSVFEGGNVAISIQLLREVTNNFSEDNVLGRGGFGVVYKGELHDGTKIAVKRMESGQSFIHRDLKPSNILLGDDMRAKVADFGLVRNAPDGKYSVETRLAGTFGYLAPEYAATGRVTTKVDVYAFGVVLMELITGRKALDETMPEDRSHLVTWFRRVLISKENIIKGKAIDQTLDTEDEETLESICKVAELAGHCTAREPYQRPDMGHAVNVLGPLVQQWKPSQSEEEDSYGIDLHMSLPQILQRWQADEGTSRMFDDSFSQTQSSIVSKPPGLADTFTSTGR
ncbi:putative protein kinase RLK-Pelle-LRR-IX family [Helianthus debilis subsp. tardiflorus]